MRGDYSMKFTFSRGYNAVTCLKSLVEFLEKNAGETLDVRHPGIVLEFSLFNWDPFSRPGHTVSSVFPLNDVVFECSGPIPNYMTVENIQMAIAGCKKSMLSHINNSLKMRDDIRDEIAYVNDRLKNAIDKKMHSIKHWQGKLKALENKEAETLAEIERERFYQQCINENSTSYKIRFKQGGFNEKRDYIQILPMLDTNKTVFPVYYSNNNGFSSVEPYLWYSYAVERTED